MTKMYNAVGDKMKLETRIKRLKEKLDQEIKINGLDSKKARRYSIQIDFLINKYYNVEYPLEKKYEQNSELYRYYKTSFNKLKQLTRDFSKFPTIEEWNYFAKENNCLNHVSMQYISGLDWHRLRDVILSEILSKKI